MRKNNRLILILSLLNLAITLPVLIIFVPSRVPFLLDLRETIKVLAPKWIMLTLVFFPAAIMIIAEFVKGEKTQNTLKFLSFWLIFLSTIYFFYFCLGENLQVGTLSEVPLSVTIFMPISIAIIIYSMKLKNAKYLSSPLAKFKAVCETEFIWRQCHIYARNVYFIAGFIMFFASIVFVFFRFPLIELAVFLLILFVSTVIVYCYSKSVCAKYLEMKEKKEKLDKKTQNQEDLPENNPKKHKNAKKKHVIKDGNQM